MWASLALAGSVLWVATGLGCAQGPVDARATAAKYYGNDAAWYLANTPVLDIDDEGIQETYYYRWKVYRSHLRQLGPDGMMVTEFLPSVPWARHPDDDLNDSSAFHLREGRWLRNPAFVNALTDHLYAGGGNDRHFSEWIGAATLDAAEVSGDYSAALRNLSSMQHVFELWDDHFDRPRNLYWIEPIKDATEYTVSSIDASGAGFSAHPSTRDDQNGFFGGFAYRPSINSYQFANATAIATLAERAGQAETARRYRERAAAIRAATLAQLWNPALQHFSDVYQRSTPTVHEGDYVRSRELVGYTPWVFGLVDGGSGAPYTAAWAHLWSADQLRGAYGLRTTEPSYPRYMTQYRYDRATGHAECQWNGPSWPFQTSEVLMGMARYLHSIQGFVAPAVSHDEYVHVLRQYTAQHRRADGTLDLQEDYDPDTGHAIVGLARSHHYEHSTYIDLVLSGLLGVEPQEEDEALTIEPLLPQGGGSERPIRYFALQGLRYHGRDLTVVFDEDGSRYNKGRGLTVFCNGARIAHENDAKRMSIKLCSRASEPAAALQSDLAANVFVHPPLPYQTDLPSIVATSSAPDSNPYEAIDGRLWFFPEIANGWSPAEGDHAPSLELDLRRTHRIGRVELAFFGGGEQVAAPAAVTLEAWIDGAWKALATAASPLANGITTLRFKPVDAQRVRVNFAPQPGRAMRVVELSAYEN